ncbi:mitogen-activated protein kinase kinase kinase 19 [Brachyistius frenatus]|uniref:mitogen-activated protein kinase kinase kinase 19 n=1 Tax=Brachyistius frenatus TaxID=100188 RepID=UPI0037E726AB
MQGRKKRESDEEMQRTELEEENKKMILVESLGPEMESQEELEVSNAEDEEERGSTPLITACRNGMTDVVQRLLGTEADLTLCNCSQQTALHVSPPELRGKMVRWMSRPHLTPQVQLLQAAWQGDLNSLQHLLIQTDRVDVNVPNSDGVTAVMLAVRDIDLFEGIAARLPWEHRPVEMIKELLGLFADPQARDHNGCSALHYAANITSSLTEELIHILVEAHTDAVRVSPLTLDKRSCQDLDSEFGDSDIELDIESLYLDRSTAASPAPPTRQHFLLHSHTGEELESPGSPRQSDHQKDLSQDKAIPSCFQNNMETLRDIREAYQYAGRGSRGLSLPSLSSNSRDWGHADPVLSSGLLNTRTPCQPVTPRHRQRTISVVVGSPPSHGPLSATEPSQLSQSAPSIMEPLLCSNTMMQARAHIQIRLGSQTNVNVQKFSLGLLPAPHSRTPKLLAPLDARPRENTALPALKQRVPLKPISRSPLCSRVRLRRERLSSGSPCNGLPITKAGSEESGCSSSQSSIDLEDEDVDRDEHERAYEDRNLKFFGDALLQHSKDLGSTEPDLVGESRNSHIPLIHRSAYNLEENLINHTSDSLSTEKALNSQHGGKATNTKETKESFDSKFSKVYNNAQKGETRIAAKDTLNNAKSITPESKEKKKHMGSTTVPETEISHGVTFTVNDDQCDTIACSEGNNRNELTERTTEDSCDEETQVDKPTVCSAVDLKSNSRTAAGKTQFFNAVVNLNLSDVDPKRDERICKALKPARNREKKTGMNSEKRANNPTNQSFNILAHEDQNVLSWNKSKGNPKYSSFTAQGKDKTRKSPELTGSREGSATKVKSKRKSVKATHCNTGTPSPRKKTVDHPQGKRAHADKSSSNRTQHHTPARELKSAQQLKKPCGVGKVQRSKSVDLLTYKDMFQQIQSGDGGPAIYEMFAGPIYENLRVSSSCEKLNERQVQFSPSRKTPLSSKVKHRQLKPAQSKLRRSPAESMVVSATGKAKPVPSRIKPHLTSVSRKDIYATENIPKQETELVFDDHGDVCPVSAQDKGGGHRLSTIAEALSRSGSETFKSDDKALHKPTTSSHRKEDHSQTRVNSSTGNQPVPKPDLLKNPQQSNAWTPSSSSSSSRSRTFMSPVYQKFLDEAGDGPLTDDLLQCLAEELISLDERDVSTGPLPENMEQSNEECNREGDAWPGQSQFPEVALINRGALLGGGLVVDDTITWTRGEVLGRGAYGTVYCGLTSQGQLIAVKQVSLDSSDSDAAKKEYNRLQGEVDLLKTLSHINIVGFLGTLLHRHVVSIFMEYIPGGSIASILHRFGPLPERVLVLYTHQILEGVAYLHLNKVVHRDLKGNNVMLMPTGVIKLIDFGCARRLSCLNHTASNSGDLLKSVHGTPYWMAPEVINETGHGRKSDIWSVGCTVFEMATGKPPLAHMDKMAALFYIGAQRGLMPSLPNGFSDNAKDFVEICLTSDQRLRPSADQLLTHSFIPQNETNVNSWETQKMNCCGPQEGRCG